MVIGILSDTHGYYHPNLDVYLKGVDVILHAGDVGTPDILDRLRLMAPVYAVYGNIDGTPIRRTAPEHQRLLLGGIRIHMTHIGGHPKRWAPGIRQNLLSEPPDVFICGHSHILRIERVPALSGLLYINPGAAGMQGFHKVKTCVRLHIADRKLEQAEVIHLDEE